MVKYSIPRFAPGIDLPPYAYVPGGPAPHPVRDPAGHSFGNERSEPESLRDDDWAGCTAYLYGIDLFNSGFYWEAHEAWEDLWHRAGRSGPLGDFLNALIVLAAAGVKLREGKPNGARRHAEKALRLLVPLARGHARLCGLQLGELVGYAELVQDGPERYGSGGDAGFDFALLPACPEAG